MALDFGTRLLTAKSARRVGFPTKKKKEEKENLEATDSER